MVIEGQARISRCLDTDFNWASMDAWGSMSEVANFEEVKRESDDSS